MNQHNPRIAVEIEAGKPTPGQEAQWRELWRKLLSQPENLQNGSKNDKDARR